MKYISLICLIVALFFSNVSFALQDTTKNADPSLNGQYQFMLSKSKTSYGAKLINPYRLSALWKSVGDTLRKERKQLAQANEQIKTQNATISTLKSEIIGKQSSLDNSVAQVNEIKFLGISFTKTTYNLIVWSIIGALGIALLIVITRSTKNILEAKHRTQLYEEINTEYQNFKAKANEKERKLARELQDERNKWDDANGR
jgi:hypothetical protein